VQREKPYTSTREPTLEEVFHGVLEIAAGEGGFVHGGAVFDLVEVAERLGVPPDAIDNSYIDRGLSEYGESLKGTTLQVRLDEGEEVPGGEEGDYMLVSVSLYRVRDPIDGGEYYAAVMKVEDQFDWSYKIYASRDQGEAEKKAKILAWHALDTVKSFGTKEDYRRAVEELRGLFGVGPIMDLFGEEPEPG